jgi:hypothetical protein
MHDTASCGYICDHAWFIRYFRSQLIATERSWVARREVARFQPDCAAGGAGRGGGFESDVESLQTELRFRLWLNVEWRRRKTGLGLALAVCNVIVDFW